MVATRSIVEEKRTLAKVYYEYPNGWSCLVDLVLLKGKLYVLCRRSKMCYCELD
jgi:hypothetical protein